MDKKPTKHVSTHKTTSRPLYHQPTHTRPPKASHGAANDNVHAKISPSIPDVVHTMRSKGIEKALHDRAELKNRTFAAQYGLTEKQIERALVDANIKWGRPHGMDYKYPQTESMFPITKHAKRAARKMFKRKVEPLQDPVKSEAQFRRSMLTQEQKRERRQALRILQGSYHFQEEKHGLSTSRTANVS